MTTHMTRRQHEDTRFPELRGARCSAFQAVIDARKQHLSLLYIQLSGAWYRFYLDAGLLFWEEGSGPEPEDDLLQGEQYTDLGETLRVVGAAVDDIWMHDSQLMMQFQNGARLVLKNGPQDGGTVVMELRPAR